MSNMQLILEANLVSEAMACLSNLGRHFGREKHSKAKVHRERKEET
jgi:hypothetical protein